MGAPTPVFDVDLGIRTHTSYDLEKTLVAFIQNLFEDAYRLDNPEVNFLQPATVPFDYTQRAEALEGKQPPQVRRGRVPRTVTGEINVDELPNFPAIIVQTISASVRASDTLLTVRIFANAYDENPNSGGYQDCINMMEVMAIAFTSFGQGALDKAYPIVMPFEWKVLEPHTFPHFIGEMLTVWQLPSSRPMPDMDADLFPGIRTPAEHIELRGEYDPGLQTPP